MTDDLKALERRLEQATARQCSGEDSLEPETAGLRAGWLALGELLEAAQPQVDPPLPRLPPLRAQRRRRRLPVAIAALAASLLIAVTFAWHARWTKPAATPLPQRLEVAQNGPKPGSSAVKQASTAPSDAELAWESSLDQEIETAGQAIRQLQQDQLASATSSGRLQYQLENLRKDIDESPL